MTSGHPLPALLGRSMLGGLLLATAGAATALEPYTARYELERGSLTVAEARYTLTRQDDGSLLFRSEATPRGLLARLLAGDNRITETSRFRLGADRGIVPLAYEYRHEDGDEVETETVEFDWEEGIALAEAEGERARLEIPPGTLDRMVLQLAVRRDLGQGAGTLDYRLVDEDELKTYRFVIADRQRIRVPAGEFYTLRVERENEDGKQTVFWCAPSLDYLPVRVEQRKPDDPTLRLSLKSVDGLSTD